MDLPSMRPRGVQQLFEHRRLRISSSRKDTPTCFGDAALEPSVPRVRSPMEFFWNLALATPRSTSAGEPGHLVPSWCQAHGNSFSLLAARPVLRQVVPPTWVLSSVEDASVQMAMREIGLLESGS
eukprot:Skav221124  [mRNA]  locus=scaffold233:443974:445461:- [translate_table: standard]